MVSAEEAKIELAIRELEKRHSAERWSLYAFVKTYREQEKKQQLDETWHIGLICDALEKVARWEIKRLMINIPPRSLKTELIARAFPAWMLGNKPNTKFIAVSYSADLAQTNSWDARAMYESTTYKKIFPRAVGIKEDQNTKQHRTTREGGQYYATWSEWTITGIWADIIIIDDPLKPDEAVSDLKRIKVNNNYHSTIKSRLNDKTEWAIIVIMQRLHDNDLCGMLIEQEEKGIWEKWEKIIVPAIAEIDDGYRKKWESFFPKRFPLEILEQMKKSDPAGFSCQMQQQPVNKESQEFHEEWFRYYWKWQEELPQWLRMFTTVDPAFKPWEENDQTCIMTAWFLQDRMYIMEYTAGRFPADVMLEKIIYHIRKWSPEKIGIEAFQAQSMIVTFLKNALTKQGLYCNIEEIRQTWDKSTKIRKLIPFYRNGLIYHTTDMYELESELKRFPKWKHDDIIDAEQMLYSMYELQPNTGLVSTNFQVERDRYWQPIMKDFSNDWL